MKSHKTFFNLIISFHIAAFSFSWESLSTAEEGTNMVIENSTDERGEKRDTKWKIRTGIELEYQDNIFRLTESQKSKMEDNEQSDIDSGRFKDMNSIDDFIITPGLKFYFKNRFPIGKFSANLLMKYNYFWNNDKASHPEGKIELEQAIGKNNRICLEGNFLYGYYRKNYLSGANDLNETGNISRSDRIYSAAVYNENETLLMYKYRLFKRDKVSAGLIKKPGITIKPLAGFRYRRYDNPFGNRDRNVMLGGLGLDMKYGTVVDLYFSYRYENVLCPNNNELVLIDEQEHGDVNNDN